MGKLLIWLSTHPDVKVRFNQDSILHTFRIRVIKGRYISEHMMDETECGIFLKNDKDTTKLIISTINHLYDEIEKEMKEYNEYY